MPVAHPAVHRCVGGVPLRAECRGARVRRPRTAPSPYDIPDVDYTHVGPECSFDAFIRRHELAHPALDTLANIVRAADTSTLKLAAQAPGLLAASLGLSAMFADDHAMLKWGMLVYDSLYAWCREAQTETHGWYPEKLRVRRNRRDGGGFGKPAAPVAPTRAEAFRYWLKLGFVSFGGPAGQIAIMHHDLVDSKRWISERRFLHALNYCMVLPGPEAQQLATYIGWLMHRTWGGVVAGGLFVLPSLVLLIALSWLYLAYGSVPAVAGILYGIKPAVVAIVLHAAWRIGSRALQAAGALGRRRARVRRHLRVRRSVSGHRPRRGGHRLRRRARRAERIRRRRRPRRRRRAACAGA